MSSQEASVDRDSTSRSQSEQEQGQDIPVPSIEVSTFEETQAMDAELDDELYRDDSNWLDDLPYTQGVQQDGAELPEADEQAMLDMFVDLEEVGSPTGYQPSLPSIAEQEEPGEPLAPEDIEWIDPNVFLNAINPPDRQTNEFAGFDFGFDAQDGQDDEGPRYVNPLDTQLTASNEQGDLGLLEMNLGDIPQETLDEIDLLVGQIDQDQANNLTVPALNIPGLAIGHDTTAIPRTTFPALPANGPLPPFGNVIGNADATAPGGQPSVQHPSERLGQEPLQRYPMAGLPPFPGQPHVEPVIQDVVRRLVRPPIEAYRRVSNNIGGGHQRIQLFLMRTWLGREMPNVFNYNGRLRLRGLGERFSRYSSTALGIDPVYVRWLGTPLPSRRAAGAEPSPPPPGPPCDERIRPVHGGHVARCRHNLNNFHPHGFSTCSNCRFENYRNLPGPLHMTHMTGAFKPLCQNCMEYHRQNRAEGRPTRRCQCKDIAEMCTHCLNAHLNAMSLSSSNMDGLTMELHTTSTGGYSMRFKCLCGGDIADGVPAVRQCSYCGGLEFQDESSEVVLDREYDGEERIVTDDFLVGERIEPASTWS